ncbi:redox-sensitive transcriptional activator SoxR [Paraburkholderia aspalathi]|uniref:redox-sensitive transcriptional activator SoxR n=1 Tax=Paraburkholderia aspalathi TaxID=1324617 RepID=UPI00190A6B5F|nr:redox-sensitive transcriptional activator SoxR [Paraburkholderia aspalathi]CAE6778456.1 Redox-sensitive transcriptional activator SoxR [Paraburkholderia aspalathi]
MNETTITIGDLARRSGVAASAIRFYEEQELISSTRTEGGHRQYRREVLRRVGFIRAAQAVGLNLSEIRSALETLPGQRTPTKQDWQRLSRAWQPLLQERIDGLIALRDQLASCVGCGCLSLKSCSLYNPGDIARRRGSGARYLSGDTARAVLADDIADKQKT